MSISMLLWLIMLVLLIWATVRWITARGAVQQMVTQHVSPLEILEQRYARGEIDTTTFQRMRAELEASHLPRS